MKATLPKQNNILAHGIARFRKEKHFYKEIAVLTASTDQARAPRIIARLYNTGRVTYCCVWITDPASDVHLIGGGKCMGYGIDRPSVAFDSALIGAGIEGIDVAGQGEFAIREALVAIAHALGMENYFLHTANA